MDNQADGRLDRHRDITITPTAAATPAIISAVVVMPLKHYKTIVIVKLFISLIASIPFLLSQPGSCYYTAGVVATTCYFYELNTL